MFTYRKNVRHIVNVAGRIAQPVCVALVSSLMTLFSAKHRPDKRVQQSERAGGGDEPDESQAEPDVSDGVQHADVADRLVAGQPAETEARGGERGPALGRRAEGGGGRRRGATEELTGDARSQVTARTQHAKLGGELQHRQQPSGYTRTGQHRKK